MQRDPDGEKIHVAALTRHLLRDTQDRCRRGRKPALVFSQPFGTKARPHVQRRQQGQADPHAPRRAHQRESHFALVGVRPPIRIVVQVVKLADLRIAGTQQLAIHECRDRFELLWRDPTRHPVHAIAPAPEIVFAAVGAFGEPGDGPLECVAMRVDQSGQDGPGERLRSRARLQRHIRSDVAPMTVGADGQHHVADPASVDPRGRREKAHRFSGHTAPCKPSRPRPPCPRAPAGWQRPALRRNRKALARSCTASGTSPVEPRARGAPDRRNAS